LKGIGLKVRAQAHAAGLGFLRHARHVLLCLGCVQQQRGPGDLLVKIHNYPPGDGMRNAECGVMLPFTVQAKFSGTV
jgi:hypothetical protein